MPRTFSAPTAPPTSSPPAPPGRRPGAASLFPDAARANPTIFYRHGRALNVAEVMANLTATGGGQTFTVPDAAPDQPELQADPALIARLDKLRSDEAMLRLVFGDNDQQGLLFTTQLMSAFGPDGGGDAGDDQAENTLGKAFGLGGDALG
ncbi:MAG: hypothetical protein WDN06_00725 [Asticcacaulis sp.]